MIIRVLVAMLIWAALFIIFYSAIPFIAWIFGGSFREIAQNVAYASIGTVGSAIGASVVCSVSFDEELHFIE